MRKKQRRLHILGILQIIYGTVHALGFFLLSVIGYSQCLSCFDAENTSDSFGILIDSLSLGSGALALCLLFAIATYAGKALLDGKPWAKGAALAFAIINLIHFPIGTLFSLFSFWVLLTHSLRNRN